MAKLKRDPINARDLEDFVANNSDFDFEMKVLAKLRSLDFECEHSGTYQDPVTHKARQFDIRARKTLGDDTLGRVARTISWFLLPETIDPRAQTDLLNQLTTNVPPSRAC
jgi:hypothetical protein